ncbi:MULTISPECIES: substrate-binding domain-containing protein [Devosia]|uniref:Phosphate-binding protein PstS n=1 Tax=Devosia equisanguinis TaxID=2490941 RepID=A0A3S4CDQ7_9HYPH|nr:MULTISPECIES: substrate-binding domain-containing protein [Devosia]ODT50546.1 MAG: phosphonate ABC transporter substrate-binding protein [Pelagibacterium sp. SCN 63-126]ODU88628.1 MAG: phosphonate ABC transporter substrate-binding protein [Pelagibacterium sp. SCN 63-17]OJX45504.1 MAG: phosphonate ABC transporter substrate-binding protein [Devosia sp. 63-57]VDS04860.1 Phosphate-binding protein PstS precursor [Devosia equisanguinis]
MKTALFASAAVIALAAFGTPAFAQSRDTIQIAGSSTVLPFASIVAEEFGATFPEFKTPVVGSGGTGGGFRQFCEGVGENTIDIANASRPIKDSEREACTANGVTDIREVQFGFDGIVFASAASGADFALTPVQVFKAIAAKVPVDGQLVDNPYTTWDQIDASLPAQPIALAIPGSNHGTREVFQEKVVKKGAEAAGLPEGLSKEELEAVETTFRQDVVVEISGDYTETLARLTSNPNTVGVFGLSFFEQNKDTLKVATIDGVTPSLDTVASGEYPVSRPLYFYVKGQHIGTIPGLAEYTEYFLSDAVSGQGGILESAGLIPQPAEKTAEVLAAFQAAK